MFEKAHDRISARHGPVPVPLFQLAYCPILVRWINSTAGLPGEGIRVAWQVKGPPSSGMQTVRVLQQRKPPGVPETRRGPFTNYRSRLRLFHSPHVLQLRKTPSLQGWNHVDGRFLRGQDSGDSGLCCTAPWCGSPAHCGTSCGRRNAGLARPRDCDPDARTIRACRSSAGCFVARGSRADLASLAGMSRREYGDNDVATRPPR